MSTSEPTGASSVAVDLALGEILRDQTLLVVMLTSGEFENVSDLSPDELLALAATFRDAFAVLDTIGWLPRQQTETVQVTISAGHVAQLALLHADLGIGIFEHLDTPPAMTAPRLRSGSRLNRRSRPSASPPTGCCRSCRPVTGGTHDDF